MYSFGLAFSKGISMAKAIDVAFSADYESKQLDILIKHFILEMTVDDGSALYI